ncbi:hypothetical protein KKG63_02560, partial [Patescibacteria group bacterium]|nr:hypothetical protein [Patescibacteria group bacterium]
GYQLSLSPLCPPSTIFIDLKKATADLESGLSRTARYSIHRAKKDGGKVEVYSHPKADLLDQIYPILKATAHHQKFYLPGIGNLKTKLTLWQNECYVALVKNAQGILCGANVFLGFQGNVWYLHSGITAEGRKANLGYFLLWQSILYLKTRGYNFLDLEGKNDCRFPSFTKTWGGFSFFKERFGGTQVCFPAPQIKYYSKAFKFLSRVYNSAMPL